MRKHIGFAALGVAFLASGCSGGSSSTSVVPAAGKTVAKNATTVKSKLTIKIPVRKHTASAKVSPKYLSALTAGLYIRADVLGGISSSTPWQSFNVTPVLPAAGNQPSPVLSQQCVVDSTGTFNTCTVTVTAPAVPGSNDEFQIIATDWAPTPAQAAVSTAPIGFILEAVDDTGANGAGEPIAAGATNAITVSLEGVIGRFNPPSPVSVWAAPGAPTTFLGYLQAFDADWYPISGMPAVFANPIVLSDSLGANSPFTYPASNTLTPPDAVTPPTPVGSIYAQMTYQAPSTTMAPVTTVNVTAPLPAWISAVEPAGTAPAVLAPATTFEIDPMTVNVLSQSHEAPIGSIDLSQGDVTLMVSENKMTTLTVAGDSGLSLTPVVASGSAQFTIPASDTSTVITITDDRNTQAKLPVGSSTANATATHKVKR